MLSSSSMNRSWVIAALGVVLMAGGAFGAWSLLARPDKVAAAPALDTPYQAVLLTSGAVYFGHLEGLGTPFPVLTDVFYIQNATNPETKQPSSVLVKRGKELHGPNRMVINAAHILLVEPVGAGSRVANLILEAKR